MHDAMNMRFFNLKIDVYVAGRWYLAAPMLLDGQRLDDPWVFTRGMPVDSPGRLLVPIHRPGNPLDFTTAGMGSTPILSERAAFVFRELAARDTQLFPVDVEGQSEPYHLLVVARTVRCIDDEACVEARYYTPEDGRLERVGEYQAVSGLRIDRSKVGDTRVFKTWGGHPALIVDGEVKVALEQAGIIGGYFEEV
ncbi:imm11 family protein [Melittangium boletus]|uniref:imm11 family protein n=1 Tax=Melittangium boletus TaxID=83453 RepID=UPI003DA69972